MYDIVFFYSSINRGGSEYALLRYLRNTKKIKNSLLVYFKDTSNIEMIKEFEKVIKVKKINDEEVINTKTAVNCMISTTGNGFFDKIRANKYILWVQVNPEIYSHYKDFDKYDRFLTTSNYIKSIVLKYPGIDERKIFLANPLVDFDEIRRKSEENQYLLKDDCINFITIARISHEKGYDYMIEVAKRLKKLNINFKWYMMGFVSKKEEEYYNNLLKLIKDNNLEDNLLFIEPNDNPYRYLKHAYLNILFSKNEAWGLVVTEAKVLGVPCIVSNNSALKEQINDSINGYLVDLPEKDEDYEIIIKRILSLINDKNLYNNMVDNLKTYGNNLQKIIEETDKCFVE